MPPPASPSLSLACSSSSSSSASSSSVPPPFTYEVIVVDDGSTDATAAVVEKWVEELGTDVVRLLTLSENQGKGAAVGKVRHTVPRIEQIRLIRQIDVDNPA